MNQFCTAIILTLLVVPMGCQRPPEKPTTAPKIINAYVDQRVEVACGQCQFGMQGDSCDLAVRIEGKSYFVEGTGIDDHGDAHAEDGFCNCIRHAKISGYVDGDRFHVAEFELEENK